MLHSEWENEAIDINRLPDVATIFDCIVSTKEARFNFAEEIMARYDNLAEVEGHEKKPSIVDIEAVIDHVWEQCDELQKEIDHETKFVLIPQLNLEQSFDADNAFSITTAASLFRLDEITHYDAYANESPISSYDEFKTHAEYKHTNHVLSEYPVNGYAYEFNDWREILAYKVYIPSHYSERQCYEFYADIFWEMTFFGIDYHDASEKQTELLDELAETSAEIDRWREEGTEDEHLISYNPTEELIKMRGRYNYEYGKRMQNLQMVMIHNIGIENAKDVMELAKKIAKHVDQNANE